MAEQTAPAEPLLVPRKGRETLWSARYLLICAAQFLSYANFMMLEPVLPLYLASLGLTPAFVGISVAIFSVASFTSRPFVGQGVDRWSPRGVYVLGGAVLGAASFGYLLPSTAVLVLGRTVHGLGWAAINTAGAMIASESTPTARRGEALSYFSLMRGLATTLTPALGLWLVAASGFPLVFALSGLFGLLAALSSSRVREKGSLSRVSPHVGFWRGLVEPAVLLPSVLRILFNTTYPITTVFVVLFARDRGIEDLSAFFLVSGVAMISAQLMARLSDPLGRAPMIAAGFVLSLASLAVMLQSTTLVPLVIGGSLWAAGVGLLEPATLALAVDKSPRGRRGAGLATYTAAVQIGFACGGLLWGFLIEWSGYQAMFLGAMAMLVAGLTVLGANWRSAGGRVPGPAAG